MIVAPNRRAVSKRAAQIKEPTIENSMLLLIPGATRRSDQRRLEKSGADVLAFRRVVQQIAHQRIGAWKCALQRDTIRPARMGFF